MKTESRYKNKLTTESCFHLHKILDSTSDYRKPDGLCTIHPDQALDFIAHLPIESFWGVGLVTAQKMHALGIHNGTQLQACTLEMLTRQFGKGWRKEVPPGIFGLDHSLNELHDYN